MNDISAALREFLCQNFLFGQELTLSDDDSFLEHGLIDSTGVLELVGFLEQQYQIAIADEELVPENLDSIRNLVRFVETKLPHMAPQV
jgi:acyl carrier protein